MKKGYIVKLKEVKPLIATGEDFSKITCRILVGEETGCLFRASFSPSGYHAKHLHTKADEFVYIISCGKGLKGMGDKVYKMEPGMCFFIPKNVVHWMKNIDEKENIEVLGVYPGVSNLDDTGYKYIGKIEE